MSESTPVDEALAAYAAAVFAKDAEAFAALYADDVHVFDSWGQWEYSGIDAWREMAVGWFGSLGDERVQVGFEDLDAAVGETVAWAHATVSFAAIALDGTRIRAMRNRMTIALELRDGRWRIAHEHTSLPIDFETGRAVAPR